MGSVHLDADDLRDLARACARRFPGADAQRRFAKELGMPPEPTSPGDAEAAWSIILASSERKGALGRLARMLAAEAPGDETFAALARTLGAIAAPPARPPWLMLGVGGTGAALLAVGIGAFFTGASQAPPTAPTALPAAREKPTPPAVDASAPEAPTTPEPGPSPTAAPAVARPAPVPAVAVVPAPVVPPRGGRLPVGCTGAPVGEVVGYWYAGTKDPGPAGGTLTLDRDARVRSDYPRAENHHNAATPERCVLARGTRFVLTAAPIEVSRGHWWVPVVGT